MFKSILLIAFSFVSLLANAQKCKYDLDKTDPFSNKPTQAIYIELDGWKKKMSLIKNGDVYQLGMSFYSAGTMQEIIKKGDTTMLKLSNNEILYFTAIQEFKPFYGTTALSKGHDMAFTTYTATYSATAEQMKKLAENGVLFYRTRLGNLATTGEVKEKVADRIKQGAKCLL